MRMRTREPGMRALFWVAAAAALLWVLNRDDDMALHAVIAVLILMAGMLVLGYGLRMLAQ